MDQFDKMLAKWQPTALSLFRIMTGLLLLQYGIAKLFKYPAVPMFAKVELMSLYGAAGSIELVLGALLHARPVHPAGRPSSCPAKWRSPISSVMFAEGLHPAPQRRQRWRSCSASLASISRCAGGGICSVDAMMRKK